MTPFLPSFILNAKFDPTEGTIVVKKDVYGEKHSDALPIPNLEVMKLLQSFASKKYVTEVYNWRWFYYYLTAEGITYLRQYLGLPEDIVPATLKITAAPSVVRPSRFEGEKSKSAGPDGDFNPSFGGPRREGGGRGDGRDSYRREGRPFGRGGGGGDRSSGGGGWGSSGGGGGESGWK